VIGPEAPLVDGLADRLRARGRAVFGPGADGARLEGSKTWMKQVLHAAGVPTARFASFDSPEPAHEYLDAMPGPFVIKTDGLAAGKGVLVTEDRASAHNAVDEYLSGAAFGEAGRRLVIEEFLDGAEISVFAVCDGTNSVLLAPSQDNKRVGEGDTGPNTGGMGAVCPYPVSEGLLDEVDERIIQPTLDHLRSLGIDYRGVLYAGRPGLDRRARAGHPPRREGAHRGVLRARRARAHPQGHDVRDLTENVEQLQVRRRSSWCATGCVAALARLAGSPPSTRPPHHRTQPQRRRAGHHPRQAVRDRRPRSCSSPRAGRRADRPLPAARHQGPGRHPAGHARPARGDAAARRARDAVGHLGFGRVLDSVGQVYPRSLDFDVVSALVQAAAAPSSLATTIRLMAGHELVTEGFKEGQVGSSAMPHKMNTRSCERVNGFAPSSAATCRWCRRTGRRPVERGRRQSARWCAGWRCPTPSSRFDGLFETFLTVLDEFGAFPAVIERELDRYLPFLATTKVLMAAVRNGVGREVAHEAIKEHAVAVALAMREGRRRNDLIDRLAADPRLGLEPGRNSSTAIADPLDLRRQRRRARSTRSSPRWRWQRRRRRGRRLAGAYRPGGVSLCDRRRPPARRANHHGRFGHRPPPRLYSGKVRDIYDAGDDRLLMVTSDRMSRSTW
jgi:adenylosuccinate lyase